MSAPLGEGGQGGIDFDALLTSQPPTTELIDPKTAPVEMLDQVSVNTEGRCLETATPLGTIAVEMYWQEGDGEEARGDFFPALDTETDPEAGANPLPAQAHPYTILPDGVLYEIVVRTPLDTVDAEWSEERRVAVGSGKLALFGGVSLFEFRRAYPGVEVDLPEGQYNITATERTKPTLAIAARVENGEPLTRMQKVIGGSIHYEETLTASFRRSALRPDTAVAVVDSRTTIRDGGKEADRQQLEFKAHDGFQRTGEGAAENSGVAEVIVMQGEAVEFTGFTFTPYTPPTFPNSYGGFNDDYNYITRGLTRGGPATFGGYRGTGGLSGGETRYRPPETVKVSMTGVRNLRAIAAFRFAMAAAR